MAAARRRPLSAAVARDVAGAIALTALYVAVAMVVTAIAY
jgi:hypothetical protein